VDLGRWDGTVAGPKLHRMLDHLASDSIAAQLHGVTKTYGAGPRAVRALNDLSVGFAARSFTAIMGPSGSGKSTLVQIAAGLERPTAGHVELAGRELGRLSETDLTRLRRDGVGFVFQAFNLMPTLTVADNVELPLRLAGRRPDRARTGAILESVGLGGRMRSRPHELSGGQRQRVAIARALVTEPAITFADEPTGALDIRVAAEVLGLLRDTVRDAGQTIVMVTHDPVAASYADRVLFLADGQIMDEVSDPTAEVVAERLTAVTDAVA
jgi:putative ABC transport system ATP-binding protein